MKPAGEGGEPSDVSYVRLLEAFEKHSYNLRREFEDLYGHNDAQRGFESAEHDEVVPAIRDAGFRICDVGVDEAALQTVVAWVGPAGPNAFVAEIYGIPELYIYGHSDSNALSQLRDRLYLTWYFFSRDPENARKASSKIFDFLCSLFDE